MSYGMQLSPWQQSVLACLVIALGLSVRQCDATLTECTQINREGRHLTCIPTNAAYNCYDPENITSTSTSTSTSASTSTSTSFPTTAMNFEDEIKDILKQINVTQSTGSRNDPEQIENFIDNVAARSAELENVFRNQKDPVRKRQMAEALQTVVLQSAGQVFSADTSSHVLDTASPEKKNQIVSKVFSTFESSGPALAAILVPGEIKTMKTEHFDMILKNIDLDNPNVKSEQFPFASDGLSFTRTSLKQLSGGRPSLGSSSVLFKTVSHLLSPPTASGTGPSQVSRVFNTKVLMVSLDIEGDILLSQNLTVTLELSSVSGVSQPVCYSMQAKSTELTSRGCTAQPINSTHIACSCNHLTSFAILMSVTEAAEESSFALDLLTYICCSLSIVFFMICFLTFVSFTALKSDRNTIHTHLVVSLGLGQLLFLAGVDRVGNETVCAVIAGCLHYLFLASFCWMMLEGLQIYMKLVLVFEPSFSMTPVYFGLGYVLPAVIVGVAAGLFPKGYGTERACWLSKERGFHWSFLGPVLFVFAWNFVMLVIAITVMCRHFRSPTKRDMSTVAKTKAWLKGSTSMAFLLGLTWSFGFLNLGGDPTVVFAYLFVLLNGSLGVSFFFFHCFGNDKVKKEYRRVMRKTEWLPDCFRRCLFAIFTTPSSEGISQPTGTSVAKGTLSQIQPEKRSVVSHTSPPASPARTSPSTPTSEPADFKLVEAKAVTPVVVQKSVQDDNLLASGLNYRTSVVEVPTTTPEMVAEAGIYMGEAGIYLGDNKDIPSSPVSASSMQAPAPPPTLPSAPSPQPEAKETTEGEEEEEGEGGDSVSSRSLTSVNVFSVIWSTSPGEVDQKKADARPVPEAGTRAQDGKEKKKREGEKDKKDEKETENVNKANNAIGYNDMG